MSATAFAGYPAPEEVRARPWRGDSPPESMLAIRLQALGDTLITLPYLEALRRALPDTRVDFLTRGEVAEIPKAVGVFDRVWEIGGGRSGRRQLLSALALLPWLRRARYDVVLDLQRNRVSRAVRRLLRPPAWSEFDRFSPRHAGERTRATIEAAGFGPLDTRLGLRPSDPAVGAKLLGEARWDGHAPLIVLNPAGALPDRNWPVVRYAELAERLLRQTRTPPLFLFLGLPGLAEKAAVLKARLGDAVVDLVGRTSAAEAFALTARASLVISEDSGLLHMAWIAAVPTLGLFAASPAAWARPLGPLSELVRACRLEDGACMHGACRGEPPACLERLEAETVLQRALGLLETAAG